MGAETTVRTASLHVSAGGDCQELTVDTNGVLSAAIDSEEIVVTVGVTCYCREQPAADVAVAALADGTDQKLAGGDPPLMYRLTRFTKGAKLGFITATGSGVVHIAPSA